NKESNRSMDNNNHMEKNMGSLYHKLTLVMKLVKRLQVNLNEEKLEEVEEVLQLDCFSDQNQKPPVLRYHWRTLS
ncbi:hypothetical protein LOAG_15613, partial [Loa loa]